MTAEEYWKSKYPEVAMPKTNHEKYVNDLEKAAIWEFAEAYHREKMKQEGAKLKIANEAAKYWSDVGVRHEQNRILGIIEELAEKSGLRIGEDGKFKPWHLLQKEELIEKIKGYESI